MVSILNRLRGPKWIPSQGSRQFNSKLIALPLPDNSSGSMLWQVAKQHLDQKSKVRATFKLHGLCGGATGGLESAREVWRCCEALHWTL